MLAFSVGGDDTKDKQSKKGIDLNNRFTHTYHNIVQLADKTEERVVGQVLESELTLSHVTWVSLTKDSVTETRNNLTTLKSSPDVILDGLLISVDTNLVLHLEGPSQNFLVGKTVEGSSKTVETGSEREVRIRESRSDQVSTVNTLVDTK